MSEQDRRTQILDAVERLLGSDGAHAVTMRAVAAEAGVSLRLVQYYGENKDALLRAALERLADRSVRRWQERALAQPENHPVTATLRAFFDEALPTDEPSRTFHRVGVSLEALAISRPDTAATAYQNQLEALREHLASLIAARSSMDASQAHLTAVEVMALAHGLGTLLMTGHISQPDAATLVGDYLHRLEPRLST